jgi:ribosomal protein S18 acetylase RimI-like enzyme
MADFYLCTGKNYIAEQIAELINKYNKWYIIHTTESVLNSMSKYFVHMEGERVVGCAACLYEYPTLSKVLHVCVVPECRKQKIASKLVSMAIKNCVTDNVYMIIREDNVASRRLAVSLGFIEVRARWFKDHNVIYYARRVNEGRNRDYKGNKICCC